MKEKTEYVFFRIILLLGGGIVFTVILALAKKHGVSDMGSWIIAIVATLVYSLVTPNTNKRR